MTFMLQKEVVERMVAENGSKTYGRLSVMMQANVWLRRNINGIITLYFQMRRDYKSRKIHLSKI
jgi:hypothetical protein